MRFWIWAVAAAAIFSALACESEEERTQRRLQDPEVQAYLRGADQRAAEDQLAEPGIDLIVRSDPKAAYRVLWVEKTERGLVRVGTRRIGSSGRDYSERLINCPLAVFTYTRTASSMEALKAAPERQDKMAALIVGSISTEVAAYACAKVGPPLGPVQPF
jgi:hypothetical protein